MGPFHHPTQLGEGYRIIKPGDGAPPAVRTLRKSRGPGEEEHLTINGGESPYLTSRKDTNSSEVSLASNMLSRPFQTTYDALVASCENCLRSLETCQTQPDTPSTKWYGWDWPSGHYKWLSDCSSATKKHHLTHHPDPFPDPQAQEDSNVGIKKPNLQDATVAHVFTADRQTWAPRTVESIISGALPQERPTTKLFPSSQHRPRLNGSYRRQPPFAPEHVLGHSFSRLSIWIQWFRPSPP